MSKDIEIHGFCDERFNSVKEIFMKNLKMGRDVGASFAATIDGEFVIDMWAGYADEAKTRPWEKDTIVNVYSTTKVMTSLCALMCIDRGLLDLDAPVATYWPEFAQAGKEKLPVRYCFSHTSGVAGFEEPLPVEALYDWDRIIKILEAQEPWWDPGTKSGYHAVSHGFLLGELIRRVTGKTPGTFLKEEVTDPLKADFHIGLSEEHDSRVAELIAPSVQLENIDLLGDVLKFDITMMKKVLANPPLTSEYSKTRGWRAAEIPAANGHGNARSIARITSALACGGEVDGVKLLSFDTIEKAIEEQSYKNDLVLIDRIRYGLGWGLTCKERKIGPNPRVFYWGGWGGSLAVVDLDAKMSFSFAMNKMDTTLGEDLRQKRLTKAMYRSL